MPEIAPHQPATMKRFWKDAAAEPREGAYQIALDGRPAKTPGKAALAVPSAALAEAMAAEWRAAGERFTFDDLPLSRLAATAIDLAPRDRDQWAEEIANYAATDLLCYRAEGPAALAGRQRDIWDPLLDWFAKATGARLDVAEGVIAIAQPEAAIKAARARATALDDFALLGAAQATQLSGSAVIGLALAARAFPAADLFAASRLDETFQAEQWGVDAEAEARERALERAFKNLGDWFEALAGHSTG